MARIDEIEHVTKHDIIAFTQAVAEHVGPEARWLHFGLTSSDVLDTALALQLRDACDLILTRVDALREAVKTAGRWNTGGRRSSAARTACTPSRRRSGSSWRSGTPNSGATPSGSAAAARSCRWARSRAPSAPTRTWSRGSKRDVCASLGLTPAPVSSQVIQRDRHAELMSALAITGASLEKFALEIRGLQKTEIGEVEEPFDRGQKGSSAMPHKRNPIGCEQVVGLARVLRGNLGAAIENIALWHERDISHSSVERIIFPDSFIGLDHMLRRFTRIVADMVVYPDRMRRNLELSRGVVFSGSVLLELASRACRGSRRTSGCSATPCVRRSRGSTSANCCSRTRT